MEIFWGKYAEEIESSFITLEEEKVISRLWEKDYTLWKPYPQEIVNRLGWLSAPQEMQKNVAQLEDMTAGLRKEGFQEALLLGMGGSSLAPDLFQKVWGNKEGFLNLYVLDSTDPEMVNHYAQSLDPGKTLYLVSTKSGNTLETLSFFKFFYNLAQKKLGKEAGKHFIAITDPGSPLVQLGERYGFRRVFLNPPDIGGRYSAFSFFGLVPAALLGIDLSLLLEKATIASQKCSPSTPLKDNEGALLGTTLGILAQKGRDKLTFFFSSPRWESFGDWLEQLVAESTGKEGKGILPVIDRQPGKPEVYGEDRLFVYIEGEKNDSLNNLLEELKNAGHPVIKISVASHYDLGEQMFIWEFATALSGYWLKINPFDQPDVESTKKFTQEMMRRYKEGSFEEENPVLLEKGFNIFCDFSASSLKEVLEQFLGFVEPGGYISIHAYLPINPLIEKELISLASLLRDKTKKAVTFGYGPRFLHSTGQLHKGDGGKGVFLQLVSEPSIDIPIPEEAGSDVSCFTFGALKKAQALGDREALKRAGRKVISLFFQGNSEEKLRTLRETFLHFL